MPAGFTKIAYVAPAPDKISRTGFEPLGIDIDYKRDDAGITFRTDEAAARFYAGLWLARDDRPGINSLTAPDVPFVLPDFQFLRIQQSPADSGRLVHFEQTKAAVPIFGSKLIVSLDGTRELLGISGDVAQIDDISPIATLSPAQALERIAALTNMPVDKLRSHAAPELMYFYEQARQRWHLVYVFRKLSVAPPDLADEKSHRHGLDWSPRDLQPQYDYLIDAHDGQLVFAYSVTPMLEIPVLCEGPSENGPVQFLGKQVNGGFELVDPLNDITTYDLALGDIDIAPVPSGAVSNGKATFTDTHRAAVSAHVNATKVSKFYKSVLSRDSIDDKGMTIISVVNCTYKKGGSSPPEWRNAVWHDNKMWYGQDKDADGNLRSFARFLDVIAHELTHGVTSSTADLVYRDQSGALNESFSDIFGVMIANWDPANPDRDVASWDWTIGNGLRGAGMPLRDLSNPRRTQYPDHMKDYFHTAYDNGGVHTNSNIHNKAAYNVLTAVDAKQRRVFTPTEAATLYYLCLSRLSRMATFTDALHELVHSATVYFSGKPARQAVCVAAIQQAYASVGID